MKPILHALGYFGLFVTLYVVITLVTVFLMTFANVAIIGGVFLATGGLTVALSIIAGVMSYHQWDIDRDVEKERIKTDHDYRLELLRIAEEQRELDEAL